jgi:hypothetical protein
LKESLPKQKVDKKERTGKDRRVKVTELAKTEPKKVPGKL